MQVLQFLLRPQKVPSSQKRSPAQLASVMHWTQLLLGEHNWPAGQFAFVLHCAHPPPRQALDAQARSRSQPEPVPSCAHARASDHSVGTVSRSATASGILLRDLSRNWALPGVGAGPLLGCCLAGQSNKHQSNF